MPARRQLQPTTGRWVRGRPSLWAILIAANVGCFVAQTIVSYADPELVARWFALSRDGIRAGHLWQFVTYMFLHGDPAEPATGALHLAMNMLAFYFAGREVEAILGRRHLFGIYFGGGILGGVAQVLLSPFGAVGSSAGVCAVLLAFTTALPEVELRVLFFFIIPVRMRAKFFAALLVGGSVLCLATGWLGFIAHYAHLGGAAVGWLYVKRLGYGNPLPFRRYFYEKRLRALRRAGMTPEQFVAEEVDPILEKIAREGIRSLTRQERRLLEMGREKIAGKITKK